MRHSVETAGAAIVGAESVAALGETSVVAMSAIAF